MPVRVFAAHALRLGKLSEGIDFAKICVLVLLIASLTVILKNFGFRGAPIFAALAFCTVLSLCATEISEILSLFSEFLAIRDVSLYTKACLKVIGIGYLAGISSDICREIGETGAAKCIGVAAKLELVLISVPFMEELFASLSELAGG